jgi:HK97 family phage portal protein
MARRSAGGCSRLVGDHSATYEELYRTQVWIHTIVNRLARGIARLPLKVYVNPDEPGERQRVRGGSLADLLGRPGERMGTNEFLQTIISNVAVHGNAVVVKRRPQIGVPPVELMPSSFAYWEIRQGKGDGETWYVFNAGHGPTFWFRPDEVLHFRWWAPGGLRAPSPIEALRTTLMVEDATQRLTIAAFENGNRPEGAFSIETGATREDIELQREQLRQVYGGVDNAFKLAILTNGAKWLPMSHNMVDSELINLRKLAREEVAAVYNMPPPVVGILDRATFSNITEQHLMEAQDTMQPWTAMIEEVFAVQLIASEPVMEGQYAEFDYGAMLAGDPVKQTDTLVKAAGGPFMTPNEARALRNLPPKDDPEADKLRPAPNASLKGEPGDRGDS